MSNAPLEPAPLRGPLAEPWSPGKLVRLLGMFGPAAILASVSIGAGETIVVVRSGAWMGYGLLWLILLASLTKGVCVTYFLGRYTAVSGEAPGQLSAEALLGRLDEVVRELEAGELPLEQALARFEEGVKLVREGEQLLALVEQRIEILLADDRIVDFADERDYADEHEQTPDEG